MNDENKQTEATPVEVECPACKHKFWHKVGHALKEVGTAAAETAVEVALPPNFGGGS
jgi:hypothetical protein